MLRGPERTGEVVEGKFEGNACAWGGKTATADERGLSSIRVYGLAFNGDQSK